MRLRVLRLEHGEQHFGSGGAFGGQKVSGEGDEDAGADHQQGGAGANLLVQEGLDGFGRLIGGRRSAENEDGERWAGGYGILFLDYVNRQRWRS